MVFLIDLNNIRVKGFGNIVLKYKVVYVDLVRKNKMILYNITDICLKGHYWKHPNIYTLMH